MNNSSRPVLLIGVCAIAILGLTAAAGAYYRTLFPTNEVVFQSPPASSRSAVASAPKSSVASTAVSVPQAASSKAASVSRELPDRVLIEMPFASQAPFGNWDMPFQEACEEASLLIVHHYYNGQPLSEQTMENEILELVRVEEEEMGYDMDVTMDELATVAEKNLGYSAEVLRNPTIEDMKKILAEGTPLIVPLAGRELGNPYYSGAGPWYHVLVIVGYDRNGFITHDVGTKRGENYHYDYDVLSSAIHDWTGVKEETNTGPRTVLVVRR
jgi:hypothetical protein